MSDRVGQSAGPLPLGESPRRRQHPATPERRLPVHGRGVGLARCRAADRSTGTVCREVRATSRSALRVPPAPARRCTGLTESAPSCRSCRALEKERGDPLAIGVARQRGAARAVRPGVPRVLQEGCLRRIVRGRPSRLMQPAERGLRRRALLRRARRARSGRLPRPSRMRRRATTTIALYYVRAEAVRSAFSTQVSIVACAEHVGRRRTWLRTRRSTGRTGSTKSMLVMAASTRRSAHPVARGRPFREECEER